eukprot:TRINITY_DN7467_c0_g1_i1.p1 TRINITY_DN7467_c0_g1~~TRINITY_DN7467_c0_g1_i1.p1  ORF type:complete len:196 (+),score=32.00 TRINITY_DN7467_c0_g1_i1:341-928(+)
MARKASQEHNTQPLLDGITIVQPTVLSTPNTTTSRLARRRGLKSPAALNLAAIDKTAASSEDLRHESWTDESLSQLFALGTSLGSEAASELADPTSQTGSPECVSPSSPLPSVCSPLVTAIATADSTQSLGASSGCLCDFGVSSPLDSAIGDADCVDRAFASCETPLPRWRDAQSGSPQANAILKPTSPIRTQKA